MSASVMQRSRLETNFRRLLGQCEAIAAEQNDNKDWRFEKYIEALESMLEDLQKSQNNPGRDTLAEYKRKVEFLKGLVHTEKLPTVEEKVAAVQHLSHGTTAASEALTKEIHQKTASRYTKELRDQLFNTGKEGIRQRRTESTTEDLDVLIRYHQSMQEKIADEMLHLAKNLKEQSQLASTIVKRDTEVVDQSRNLAESNFERLKAESLRLEEQNKKGCKCWIWVMMAIVCATFAVMVTFMRLFRKRTG